MRFGWLFCAAALFIVAGMPSLSQVPTAEQLELLRSMSPEDRRALMEQLGVDESIIDGAATSTTDSRRDSRRRAGEEQSRDLEALNYVRRNEKLLQPEDQVLISIEFKKDKPAKIETPVQGQPPITIPAEPAPVIDEPERSTLATLMDLVRRRNPYELDRSGALHLPGFSPIVIAGLTDDQATSRLSAIPTFSKLDIKVAKLPIRKIGVAGLKPFGYDLFKDAPTTFAPTTDVPVPAEYIIGPGDQLVVQIYGNTNRTIRLLVGRDGRINFPELGPIAVGGRNFQQVSQDLEARVARQMIGVRVSVSMGDTRSIRVFVMGEANRPGSYTVSGLATITSALYASGGIKSIGSLRDIQLKRRGALVKRIDLYDLLLRGDTADDANLLPGDVIFIPPVSATVAVDGEVNRPAIYELKGDTTVDDMINLAGGLTGEADPSRIALIRVNDRRERVVVDVPLNEATGRSEILRRGDSLRVLRLRPTLDLGVSIEGHVFRPGVMAWHDGMRITDALPSVDELRPNADLNYVMIRRERDFDRRVLVLSADLGAALSDPGSSSNLLLEPRDRLIVFDTESGRQEMIAPILDEIRRQARIAYYF